MSRPLRGAVIGCGFFAANHLHGWNDLEDAEIIALCDRDPARLEAASRDFGITKTYDDAAALLASERLDFVDIATTVESHRPLVELAARHGVPAICQKPFALSLEDAQAMVEACRSAGVPLMVHENFRWQSPQMRLKELLQSGWCGRPFFARISFRHAYDIYTNQPYLKTEPRLAIMDLGIHLLDLARFFLGEAARAYARTDRINPEVAGEDAVVILLDHVEGAKCVVDFSFATPTEPDPFPETAVRLEGNEGTVELETGYRLVRTRKGERHEEAVEPPVPAWGAKPWHIVQESVVNIQRHWLSCLREGREPATSGADNLKTLALVEAAYASAASGQPVEPEHR